MITTVLALLAVSSAATVLGPTGRAQLAEPVARAVLARQLLAGGASPGATAALLTPLPGPTRIPTLVVNPHPLVGAPGEHLAALVDGRAEADKPTWRSAPGRVALDLQFTTTGPVLAGRVLFAHSTAAPPETWAKEVEVWVSPDLADPGGGIRAGRWTLEQLTGPQLFSFPRTRVQRVRLRILSTFGRSRRLPRAHRVRW